MRFGCMKAGFRACLRKIVLANEKEILRIFSSIKILLQVNIVFSLCLILYPNITHAHSPTRNTVMFVTMHFLKIQQIMACNNNLRNF